MNDSTTPIPPRYKRGTTARIRIALIVDDAFYTPDALPIVAYTDTARNAIASAATPLLGDAHSNFFYDLKIADDAPAGVISGSVSFFDDLANPCGSRNGSAGTSRSELSARARRDSIGCTFVMLE